MSGADIWTWVFVAGTFGLYIAIALATRAGSTDDFYVAGHDVHPVVNGMATAADWMSAASFISMAGLIAFLGYGGSVYLMGWTGGYVLLALLLAPYLRQFGTVTVPDFVGERFDSRAARVIAVVCALFVSFTYIAGQMKGVGVAFSNFLDVDATGGILIGMGIVFVYAVLGGMKGITYTQVAQYVVLIFAYTVPAIFLSLQIAGTPVPQLGFVGNAAGTGEPFLARLDRTLVELGFTAFTDGTKSTVDIVFITAALMFGTAGLPHVIIRFFTVRSAAAARVSAGWALVFIALLYTTAPAVGAFARANFIDQIDGVEMTETPEWFDSWRDAGYIEVEDLNGDGAIQYRGPASDTPNEVEPNRDIFVLANPQIAGLPGWVVGLVVAGGLAAALSTAAGLLMVISSAVSHDLLKRTFMPDLSPRAELRVARASAAGAVVAAGLLGIFADDLGFVAQVVAFAFGLAAASLFPVLLLGIFWTRFNAAGAMVTMVTGLVSTFAYIVWFKFVSPDPSGWWWGISPEGIGFLFLWPALAAGVIAALATPAPREALRERVLAVRVPQAEM